MTLINFDLRAVAATGRVPADATIRWQPTQRRVDGSVVILPEVRSVKLAAGVGSADLDPGYYWFTEANPAGVSAVRYVPAAGPVDYAAMPPVDPATLEPAAPASPGWLAMAASTVDGGTVVGDDLVLHRTDGGTVNAGNVRGLQGIQGVQGIQGNQGLKGDPGGIVLGNLVPNGADFNTITTDGVYRLVAPTGTLNAPPSAYGVMYVNNAETPAGTRLVQTFHPGTVATSGRYIAERALAGGIWSPWRIIPSQRVDTTAGRAIYTWDDGAAREQLIYGDTGWRDISALVTGAAGTLYIRRVGQQVIVQANSVQEATTVTGVRILVNGSQIPGMYPSTTAPPRAVGVTFANTVYVVEMLTSGELRRYTAETAPPAVSFMLTYFTNSAWPTTLPGAAVSTVPNV
jgi:hypothetical protein